ncbi:Lactate utilization protein B/C [Alkalidesulfovibrio alkalitolerans DSM 16529]|uniref:Lactate utilization protein B/C n=1 Tax=Alkalidesulfovibrio alkalitolerans DSM 16529 TaxID=1121439 RepID=S7TF93_9BACT|nr:lactate utilization protein [Alkalidesulfovibrio alkalitolerans]EPR35406.1 Lactate utilization protein B/C [Alkalidesulfovibrio alkalitolerans DSM 16529]
MNQELVSQFTQKAQAVSAIVTEVKSLKDAYAYAVDVCLNKEACQLLPSGCGEAVSDEAAALCETKAGERVIAAPSLDDKQFKELSAAAKKAGIKLVKDGMRNHLAGIDIGFCVADLGLAETGSLVLDSSSEDLRLSTMVSEINVVVLPLSKLRATSYAAEDELLTMMRRTPNYLAFITGASRTADIERVLAIGVHGPLELHILLWRDA